MGGQEAYAAGERQRKLGDKASASVVRLRGELNTLKLTLENARKAQVLPAPLCPLPFRGAFETVSSFG